MTEPAYTTISPGAFGSGMVLDKNIVFFSLVTNTIYIFSLQQTEVVSTIKVLISSRKVLERAVLVWHYATDASTSKIETDVTFCTLRQSDGSYKRLSLIANLLLSIH